VESRAKTIGKQGRGKGISLFDSFVSNQNPSNAITPTIGVRTAAAIEQLRESCQLGAALSQTLETRQPPNTVVSVMHVEGDHQSVRTDMSADIDAPLYSLASPPEAHRKLMGPKVLVEVILTLEAQATRSKPA
jgi:hypothetical protein